MQSHLSYCFYSLTTDINPASQNPRVLSSQPGRNQSDALNVSGVRVYYYFSSGCLSIRFHLQLMATLKVGDKLQMWAFMDGSDVVLK